MKIFVDIDETICFYESKEKRLGYQNAIPNEKNIAKINKLYDDGHEITYWTARGTVNVNKREEYLELTANQLGEWGCQYHKLSVGEKPNYDLLICDKTKRIEEI